MAVLNRLSHSNQAIMGGIMITVLLPMLLFSLLVDFGGWLENQCFAVLLYILFVPLLLVAIILITYGNYFTKKQKQAQNTAVFSYNYLKSNLMSPAHYSSIRKKVYFLAIFTALFLFFLSIATHGSYYYSNTNHFCARFCHQVLSHAAKTHYSSPHSRVDCMECHKKYDGYNVSGTDHTSGLVKAYKTITKSSSTPIKIPASRLRPSNESCEKCHWPDKFHGKQLRIINSFQSDESNSHTKTALYLNIGSGGSLAQSAQGIHWHTSRKHRLYYLASDEERLDIVKITLDSNNGTKVVYTKEGRETTLKNKRHRLMDCVDCHNRPTHYIFSPEKALDKKLLSGEIPQKLPFIKQQALVAITKPYPSTPAALKGISDHLRGHYSKIPPEQSELLAQAIRGTQQAYTDNVSIELGVDWNTYPNFIGHAHNGGCFRCHNSAFKTKEGKGIPHDCKLCHLILAENEPSHLVLQKVFGIKAR